jgi:hypothetical protein
MAKQIYWAVARKNHLLYTSIHKIRIGAWYEV